MKRILTTTALAFSVMLLASPQKASAQAPPDGEITYQQFYDDLDPYGQWIDNPDYGYVWRPDLGSDFQPYSTNGHWVWSDDYEWMWVSDYDWGWAPFHYGRWFNDPGYGWMWMPGYEWSPAWVAWRDGGDYYGWAPIRPGINISIGFSLGSYNPPVDYWCFAPRQYITSPRIWDYCAPRRNNITIINQTTIINNYNYGRNIYRTGPGRRDAERYTGGRINSVRFRESNTPGRSNFRNNEVSMFRPRVQHDNNNNGRNFAPRRVEQFDRNRGNDANTGRGNGNNIPGRRDGNNDGRFNQNNRGQGDNGIADRRTRRFERPDNNGNTNNDRNTDRPNVFDRNNDRRNNNGGGRPPIDRNTDRQPNQAPPVNPNPNNDRRTERRNVFDRNNTPNDRNNAPNSPGRNWGNDRPQRQQPTFPQPQQQPRQQQPQMEQRRFEQPRQQQPRMEQPRQFERRNDNGGQPGGGNSGRGRGGRR